MAHQTTFTGADFALQSVTQIALGTVRVRFTQDPLASDPAGANDALNLAQYTLQGPVANAITFAATVADDPQAIDLTVAAPFVVGEWTLTCSQNLQTASGRPLQNPRSLSFIASYLTNTEALTAGAENDSAESVLRKHLSPALKGKNWDALIAAIATGDRWNWDNARKAFDQLFKSSASSFYLDRKCSDDGLSRPPAIGMPDDLFRKLAIKTTAKKLTQQVLLEILEVFYGSDSVRAFAETDLAEPYVLSHGWALEVLLDERDSFRITFNSADFAQIGQAKAIEVAAAITRNLRQARSQAYAVAITDPNTGLAKVRIYSGSLGLSSAVRVVGGEAQPALEFPSRIDAYTAAVTSADAYNWVVTSPSDGVTVFTLNTNGAAKIDLNRVQAGDYVIVDQETAQVPGGIYKISDVGVEYAGSTLTQSFRVDVSTGFTGTATQLSEKAYRFYRPIRNTIQRGNNRTVVVGQSNASEVNVVLPATTQAVGRTAKSGAYAQARASLEVSSLTRDSDGTVTVTVPTGHGLSAGDQVYVEEVFGGTVSAPVVAGNKSTGLSDGSKATIFSETAAQTQITTKAFSLTRLQDGRVLVAGGQVTTTTPVSDEQECELFAVTGSSTGNGVTQYQYAWSAATSMASPRSYHAATLLEDSVLEGQVLVTGGFVNPNHIAGTEIYTPAAGGAGSWNAGPALTQARALHTQTLLADGKVLIAGGAISTASATATTEIFNPADSTIGAGASMLQVRSDHQAIRLRDGRVLVVGGSSQGRDLSSYGNFVDALLATCEIYTPGSGGGWARTGSMTWSRAGHRLVLLDDGRVLVIGGRGRIATQTSTALSYIRDMEIFDPSSGRWSGAGKLSVGRYQPAVEKLGNGKVAILFGTTDAGNPRKGEYIDGATLLWGAAPNLYAPSSQAAYLDAPKGLLLDNGLVFLHGGVRDTANAINPPSALFIPGADSISVGGLNGIFRVESVASPTAFTYKTPAFSGYTVNQNPDPVVVPVAASTSTVPGPFVFDPGSSPAVTAISTTTTQTLDEDGQYTTLAVADALVFPDSEGWLCIGFGTEQAVYPVRYLGRYSANALILDYQFKFPVSVGSGASVTLLHEKGAFSPVNAENLGSFYVTSSPGGRVAAVNALEQAVAAGVNLKTEIVYPGDRGLGGEGLPTTGTKIADKVAVWGGDDLDADLAKARGEE